MKSVDHRPKLLAVASGGGHWVQLMRLQPAFCECDVTFVTVNNAYAADVPGYKFYLVNDATRWNKMGLVTMTIRLAWIILREQPAVVISTGAAPGYVAIRLARLVRARSVWVDSFANMEALSLSGQKIGRYVDLWLTQWQHLARPEGPHYAGSVL